MLQRILAAVLCLCLLSTILPAAGAATTDLTMSQKGIDFIKAHEGFTKYATWDYNQYTIGYGTRCDPGDYPNGISEAEAERLLREFMVTFENSVNRFASRNNLTFTQNEFDALVSFTYNLGPAWTNNGTRLINWLKNRTTEMEFVNALGVYCHAGGRILTGLVNRRIREVQMFLYGDYTGNGEHKYTAVALNPNGGNSMTPDIYYFALNSNYGNLPTATRSGYYFAGWFNNATGGEQILPGSLADRYRTIYAHWSAQPVALPAPQPDPVPEPKEPVDVFTDVARSSWYYEYVNKSVKYGLFNGTSATTFSPENTMSRAMIATVLYRMADKPVCTAETPFTDVDYAAYYGPAVRWCYANMIIDGKTSTTFDPNGEIKRQELIALIYRFASFKQLDITNAYELAGFADAAYVDRYAQYPLGWAVANGIIGGSRTPNGLMLYPKAPASRAEAAKILVQFLDVFKF